MKYLFQGVCCLLLLSVITTTHAKEKLSKEDRRAKQKKLHDAFIKTMHRVDLVGKFTVDGRKDNAKEERYEIQSVKKGKGDNWIITARIKYGKTDVEVPVTVNVFWADDTPVITMTDMKIPLMGVFTCRVMIYGDRYAGTWQHGKVGGLMYGHLEKRLRTEMKENSEQKK